MSNLKYSYTDKTILDFIQLWENGYLNLNPGFQRNSVWNKNDRSKLIQSLLDGYPIPSVFFYCRENNGVPIYDVIDGKQRIETILMYTRASKFKNQGFSVKYQFPEDENQYFYDWKEINKWKKSAEFLTNKIQTVEVSGDLSDIIDLFVRINSTGKPLTSSEKRNANFYTSPYLKHAKRLAESQHKYFKDNQIISTTGFTRMRDVELVSELLASIHNKGPINKKIAVDRAIGNESFNANSLQKVKRDFTYIIGAMKKIFPDLKYTRFNSISEFYTLFMVVWAMWDEGLVLNEKVRNEAAQRLLIMFSNGVDEVRDMQKRISLKTQPSRIYTDYLLTVQQATDNVSQRKRRAQIVREIFGGLYEAKDKNRIFSSVQRRLIWNGDERKKCTHCNAPLDWLNFEIDHIKPHSRGGKTDLHNAALICRSCNASIGSNLK